MESLHALVQARLRARGVRVLLAVLGLALAAQVRVVLPFTPVPVTGQTFGVLLAAALLPPGEAVMAMALYVLAGTLGLPVFTGSGGGWSYLLGPTGGYLLGFIAAAGLLAAVRSRWPQALQGWRLWPALALGNLAIYALGLPWLAVFVGWERVLALGFLPFLPGDLLKLLLAGLTVQTLQRWHG